VCKAVVTSLRYGTFLPIAGTVNAHTVEDRVMAEQQGAIAVEEQPFEYPIRIEEAGPATKKVFIEIPQERIALKLEEQFKELRQQAAIPGFRVGHAPKKLIE